MLRMESTSVNLSVVNGQVVCDDGTPFSREDYSHFKYGWLRPAHGYAIGLAKILEQQLWEIADGRPVRIISAPYKFLATASHAIAQDLCRLLGHQAIQRGIEPPTIVPFHKSRTGSSQYAKSSAEDRLKSLATLGLRIDQSLVTGCVVLVVDDIRITGSAQAATASYLEAMDPHCVWYLHAARLDEATAKANPGLEDELNQTVSHSFEVILSQMRSSEFQLNTRVLRHMLESEEDALCAFLSVAPNELLVQMYDAIVGSGLTYYHRHEASAKLIFDELTSRHLAPTYNA